MISMLHKQPTTACGGYGQCILGLATDWQLLLPSCSSSELLTVCEVLLLRLGGLSDHGGQFQTIGDVFQISDDYLRPYHSSDSSARKQTVAP